MGNHDDELLADDHLHFTGLDEVTPVDEVLIARVLHGADDLEQLVLVALQLGALVGGHGILDDELVDVVALRHLQHLLFRGFL